MPSGLISGDFFDMNILLIYPPMRLNDEPRNFPNGIALIAALLLQKGYNVDVLDINGRRYSQTEVLQKISESIAKYDVIGIGGLITAYSYAKWLIRQIKMLRDIPVVIGGYLGSNIPEIILLKTSADFVVVGEAEFSLPALFAELAAGNETPDIAGVWYRSADGIVNAGMSKRLSDMDSLPFPAWHLFPMNDVYLKLPVTGFGRDIDLITSRGCPYPCVYCYKTGGRRYRQNSAEYVVEEIKFLKKEYNIDFVSFQDNEFMADKKRVYKFCELATKEKLGIKWTATSRVNLVDEDILTEMKKSGCVAVSFGIESGSQKILDVLKKGVTVEQAVSAMDIVNKVGLKYFTSFMIGSPGETIDTIKDTIAFCKKVNIGMTSCMFTTPYPGTELYEWAQEHKKVPRETDEVEQYIMKLQDCVDFTVNLTDFPDEELVHLHNWMIKQTWLNYVKPSTGRIKKQFIELYGKKQFNYVISALKEPKNVDHFRKHGFNSFLELLPIVEENDGA